MGVPAGKPVFENAAVEEMFSHGTKQRKHSDRQSAKPEDDSSFSAPEDEGVDRTGHGRGPRWFSGRHHTWLWVAGAAIAIVVFAGIIRRTIKHFSHRT